MANALTGERFVILTRVTPAEFFSTDFTAYRTLNTDGAGTTSMESGIFSGQARFPFFAMSSFPLASETGASVPLPESADPPFPPVYPYFFSTDQIYGRDKMNTVIRMVRGDTYVFDVSVQLDGAPYNLAGVSLVMTGKWAHDDADADAIFQKTIGNGIVVTDAANGLLEVTIAHSDTYTLPPASSLVLVYDIEMRDGTKVYTISRGDLVVIPDVTEGA